MKRIATSLIIVVQLWMLSPVCCCWFKAVAQASGAGDCCCSGTEGGSQDRVPAEKDEDCRCSSSKIELPPQTVVVQPATSHQLAFEHDWAAAHVALAVVEEPSGLRPCHEWPPPLAVADRLATLHRLNL